MRVRDLMSSRAPACLADSPLEQAANLLWETDAGAVAVVDDEGLVIGLITERDVCRIVATRSILPQDLRAQEAMSSPSPTCGPEDEVASALRTLARHRLQTLPVVDAGGKIEGSLSLRQILLQGGGSGDWTPEDLVQALAEIWTEQALPESAVLCGWEHR